MIVSIGYPKASVPLVVTVRVFPSLDTKRSQGRETHGVGFQIFHAGAGAVDDDPLVAFQEAADDQLFERDDASGALRRNEQPFVAGKLDPCVDEIGVADCESGAAARAYGLENQKIAKWLGHSQAARDGFGVLPELAAQCAMFMGAHDGLAPFRLH